MVRDQPFWVRIMMRVEGLEPAVVFKSKKAKKLKPGPSNLF